jgi:hypothetical protein
MNNLIKAVQAEIEKRYAVTAEDFTLQTVDGRQETKCRAYRQIGRAWSAKPYKGTPEQVEKKIRAALAKKKAAALAREMAKIEAAQAAPDTLGRVLIIKLEAYKGYMGWQWKGSDNFGNEGRYTGGCGYDKHSTALAEILNLHLPILKRLYKAEDKRLGIKKSDARRDVIGYGSGYGVVPYFEGGVGSSCHVQILERLGYTVTEGNNVFVISEK